MFQLWLSLKAGSLAQLILAPASQIYKPSPSRWLWLGLAQLQLRPWLLVQENMVRGEDDLPSL